MKKVFVGSLHKNSQALNPSGTLGAELRTTQALGLCVLGGSWDLVSKVISTLIGVISMVTLIINPSY